MEILHKDDFQKEVLEYNGLVLVDFWAPWCGPCRIQKPIVEELAVEQKDKIKIVTVNVDENSELAEEYKILSIPTLIFFKNGKQMEQIIGASSKNDLVKKIESLL